ncbi:Uncharacterised protein [Mycobacterium tuberculosis]|nr:Uncharacterised protein [Mycobacterium tuberculosis]
MTFSPGWCTSGSAASPFTQASGPWLNGSRMYAREIGPETENE